jgi:hypothetical protein
MPLEIRFVVFPTQQHFIRSFDGNATVGSIRASLMHHSSKPEQLQQLTDAQQMRLIFCGKVLDDERKTVEELWKDKSQVTVHVVINQRNPSVSAPATTTTTPTTAGRPMDRVSSSPIHIASAGTTAGAAAAAAAHHQSPSTPSSPSSFSHSPGATQSLSASSLSVDGDAEDWGRSVHFHGCFFNEDEAQQVKVVFERKKGDDDLMEFTDVHMFLRSYWKWLGRNRHRSR